MDLAQYYTELDKVKMLKRLLTDYKRAAQKFFSA